MDVNMNQNLSDEAEINMNKSSEANESKPSIIPSSCTDSKSSSSTVPMLFVGKNIHTSKQDGKLLCSFSQRICNQRRLNGYAFCIRHILQDASAPFKQCQFMSKLNSTKCSNAVPVEEERVYCYSHLQVLGLTPKRVRKKASIEKSCVNLGITDPDKISDVSMEPALSVTPNVSKSSKSGNSHSHIPKIVSMAEEKNDTHNLASIFASFDKFMTELKSVEIFDDSEERLEILAFSCQNSLSEHFEEKKTSFHNVLEDQLKKMESSLERSIYEIRNRSYKLSHTFTSNLDGNKFNGYFEFLQKTDMCSLDQSYLRVKRIRREHRKCRANRSSMKCARKPLPCCGFCRLHVKNDKEQLLFTPCSAKVATPSGGLQTCNNVIFDPHSQSVYCEFHLKGSPYVDFRPTKADSSKISNSNYPLKKIEASNKSMVDLNQNRLNVGSATTEIPGRSNPTYSTMVSLQLGHATLKLIPKSNNSSVNVKPTLTSGSLEPQLQDCSEIDRARVNSFQPTQFAINNSAPHGTNFGQSSVVVSSSSNQIPSQGDGVRKNSAKECGFSRDQKIMPSRVCMEDVSQIRYQMSNGMNSPIQMPAGAKIVSSLQQIKSPLYSTENSVVVQNPSICKNQQFLNNFAQNNQKTYISSNGMAPFLPLKPSVPNINDKPCPYPVENINSPSFYNQSSNVKFPIHYDIRPMMSAQCIDNRQLPQFQGSIHPSSSHIQPNRQSYRDPQLSAFNTPCMYFNMDGSNSGFIPAMYNPSQMEDLTASAPNSSFNIHPPFIMSPVTYIPQATTPTANQFSGKPLHPSVSNISSMIPGNSAHSYQPIISLDHVSRNDQMYSHPTSQIQKMYPPHEVQNHSQTTQNQNQQ